MTAVGASTASIVFDFFLALGFSLGVWFCYQLFFLILSPKKAVTTTLLHMLYFAVAGFFTVCFIIGKTASQEPRWHMALGFALGAWVYYGVAARYLRTAVDHIRKSLALASRPLVKAGRRIRRGIVAQLQTARRYLQKQWRLFYNSRVAARKARRARRKQDDDNTAGQTQKKKPVQAYTQN